MRNSGKARTRRGYDRATAQRGAPSSQQWRRRKLGFRERKQRLRLGRVPAFYRPGPGPWRAGHAKAARGARPDSGVQVGHGEEEDPTGGAHMAAAAGERREGGGLGREEGIGPAG